MCRAGTWLPEIISASRSATRLLSDPAGRATQRLELLPHGRPPYICRIRWGTGSREESLYLLYCDETNMEEKSGDFLLYAGVAIDPAQARALSDDIESLRLKAGVNKDFTLKFNPGPPGLSHDKFACLKQDIIKAAVDRGSTLFAYVVLHDISKSKGADQARRNGINTVCYHFDCFLNRAKSSGVVLIDRFNDKGNVIDGHLREKFSTGLTGMPYSGQIRLKNIVGVHYSAIGQSHFTSLVDIVVGSLRFAINAHTRKDGSKTETATKLLGFIAPLFFREEGRNTISEIGFQFSPKVVTANKYRVIYEGLKSFLEESGVVTEQPITDQRTY